MSLPIDQRADWQVEAPCPIESSADEWWVVHTKSRQEKALAANLAALKITTFLPLVGMRRIHGGRVVEVEMPFFPGYLFIAGGAQEREQTFRTNRVAQVIAVVDQQTFRSQLKDIHRLISSRHPVHMYPGLKKGRRCRVTQGCLKGIEGVVIRRKGACRVYVAVDVLGQSSELQIAPALLEPVDV